LALHSTRQMVAGIAESSHTEVVQEQTNDSSRRGIGQLRLQALHTVAGSWWRRCHACARREEAERSVHSSHRGLELRTYRSLLQAFDTAPDLDDRPYADGQRMGGHFRPRGGPRLYSVATTEQVRSRGAPAKSSAGGYEVRSKNWSKRYSASTKAQLCRSRENC
jgi:hypothetical protein